MAYSKRPLNSKQAWRIFEDAVKDFDGIKEAADWLHRHPEIARKMTGTGLLACFDEDLKHEK